MSAEFSSRQAELPVLSRPEEGPTMGCLLSPTPADNQNFTAKPTILLQLGAVCAQW